MINYNVIHIHFDNNSTMQISKPEAQSNEPQEYIVTITTEGARRSDAVTLSGSTEKIAYVLYTEHDFAYYSIFCQLTNQCIYDANQPGALKEPAEPHSYWDIAAAKPSGEHVLLRDDPLVPSAASMMGVSPAVASMMGTPVTKLDVESPRPVITASETNKPVFQPRPDGMYYLNPTTNQWEPLSKPRSRKS